MENIKEKINEINPYPCHLEDHHLTDGSEECAWDAKNERIFDLISQVLKDWNCHCEKPKADNQWRVGEYEGSYQRCKNCDRRIWR